MMLRKILIALAVIGLADSLYLTWIKVMEDGICQVSSGCEVVNTSPFASIAGIPIAAIGAGAYITMLLVLLLEPRLELFEVNSPTIVFGLSLIGVLYSAYLTYLEIYVIRAICPFCVVSAVVLVAMLIVSALRLRQSLTEA
jgi:uncharacterized membrane protein